MYKLHKRGQQLFFDIMATKVTLELLSKIISKIRYSKYCILYHIQYTTIWVLLYQPLRFILTFKSNRSMISFGRKHCKYGMHNMKVYIIYFYASFLGIAFKSFIGGKVFVRTIDSLYVFINHYPQHVLCFYISSYLWVMHFFCLKKQDNFRKSCVDFYFISLIHSYIYIHIALCYQ